MSLHDIILNHIRGNSKNPRMNFTDPMNSVFYDFDYDVRKIHGQYLPEFGSSFDVLEGQNPYLTRLSAIPRKLRGDAIDDRATLYGVDFLLDPNIAEAQTGPGQFQVLKQPTPLEPGYGTLISSRASTFGATTVDEVATLMNASTTTVQISSELTGQQRSFSGTAYSAGYLRSQAQHFLNMKGTSEGIGAALQGDMSKVMFLDVETSGVHQQARIWELHTSMGDTSKGYYFGGAMDGAYGNFAHFDDYAVQQGLVPPNAWQSRADGFMDFLRKANSADYIVAHNAPFDMEMITRELDTLVASGQMTQEFVKEAEKFVADKVAKFDSVVDTRMLSAILIDASSNLVDDTKRISMEAILTTTSALENMHSEGLIDDSALRTLRDKGLHSAQVDVDAVLRGYTKLVHLVAQEGEGSSLLRERTTDQINDFVNTALRTPGGDSIVQKIRESSAITPVTKDGKTTPLMRLIQGQRDLTSAIRTFSDSQQLKDFLLGDGEPQGFSRWVDSIMEGDFLRPGSLAPGDDVFDTAQRAAMDAELPFGGLSAPERVLSNLMGRNNPLLDTGVARMLGNNPLLDGSAQMQSLFSEMLGISTFTSQMPETNAGSLTQMRGVRVHSGNLALTSDLLMNEQLSKILFNDEKYLVNALTGADPNVAPLEARYSFFSYADTAGNVRKDVALNIDPFRGMTDDAIGGIVTDLKNLLQNEGVAGDIIDEITVEGLKERGIQLGILRTGDQTDAIYNVAEVAGLTRDVKDPNVARTYILNMSRTDDGGINIHTGPAIITEGDTTLAREFGDDLVDSVRATRGFWDTALGQESDSMLATAARLAQQEPRARGAIRKALTAMDFLSQNRKPIGIATAALFGGYYFNKKQQEQAPYDEAMSFSGYESATQYEDYKRDMGEFAQPQYQQRHMDALETAGMVQGLDYHKVSHHNMSNDRHSHLFSF